VASGIPRDTAFGAGKKSGVAPGPQALACHRTPKRLGRDVAKAEAFRVFSMVRGKFEVIGSCYACQNHLCYQPGVRYHDATVVYSVSLPDRSLLGADSLREFGYSDPVRVSLLLVAWYSLDRMEDGLWLQYRSEFDFGGAGGSLHEYLRWDTLMLKLETSLLVRE
jgi:hypothetical protein